MQIIPIRASRPALAPAPRILPDTTDKTLEERAFARQMASYALPHTGRPFALELRQLALRSDEMVDSTALVLEGSL